MPSEGNVHQEIHGKPEVAFPKSTLPLFVDACLNGGSSRFMMSVLKACGTAKM
jgi:hypothetical protein